LTEINDDDRTLCRTGVLAPSRYMPPALTRSTINVKTLQVFHLAVAGKQFHGINAGNKWRASRKRWGGRSSSNNTARRSR